MNLRMAIQAAAVATEIETGGAGGMSDDALPAHVIRRRVAVEAEEGHFFLQQTRIHRTMRIVAIGAVLAHRLVFPQHRTALFGMASVADVIDADFLQQSGSGRSVGIVTVR